MYKTNMMYKYTYIYDTFYAKTSMEVALLTSIR